ncbi:MAG: hypothetical protein ABI671_07510 [Burkholderiales bacterium]
MKTNRLLRAAELSTNDDVADRSPVRAKLIEISEAGEVMVESAAGTWPCDVLLKHPAEPAWLPGDRLLVLPPLDGERAVVLGRVGRYQTLQPTQPDVVIEAGRSLVLKCGTASIDLRADGKVMVRGEDVLLRAKGTQRIRAGTVSIN